MGTYTPHFTGNRESRCGLFPVHSPLLRESMLVSLPPLTYMLKFSGCAYLKSDWWVKVRCSWTEPAAIHNTASAREAKEFTTRGSQVLRPSQNGSPRQRPWRTTQWTTQVAQCSYGASNTNSDIHRENPMYRMRSKSCRFPEFRTSQCLSQFAAFFLDPRTKAFTVANIKLVAIRR